MDTLRIGIIGAGRMGNIRANSAQAHPGCQVAQVVDVTAERAQALASEVGCQAGADWEALLARPDIDAVVVATPHKYLAPITIAALQAGKHVFCEKPMGRTAGEVEQVLACHRSHPRALVVGFTLRHHPAIARARELLTAGAIGEPFYVRGQYGHGGRPGYDQEWRADRDLAGGGELLDQGIHLIDLSRWFLGEFTEVAGFTAAYFWGTQADAQSSLASEPVEDNAFVLLRTASGLSASLHASWTQWKNLFRFEVFGREGFIMTEGLGGSYGPERLILGHRRPAGGPPATEEVTFDGQRANGGGTGDVGHVWASEWAAFVNAVAARDSLAQTAEDPSSVTVPSASAAGPVDAKQALCVIAALYEAGGRDSVRRVNL
jgi:predicted dehydrogenase